ncbi:MAG TPA: hypothetical protein PK156_19125, partial [Polyangium sp.]|nr:hypothetical protein [Polyangium sp.]
MALIIPGVQVTVVKEVLPQQLAPSGVLGLIGFVEKSTNKVERASSWTRFLELFGAASAYSLPEARQALDNGVYELAISPLTGGVAASVQVPIKTASSTSTNEAGLSLVARVPGTWSNGLMITIKYRDNVDTSIVSFDLSIKRPGGVDTGSELFRDVRLANLAEVIERSAIVKLDATATQKLPAEGKFVLAGGVDAAVGAYTTALTALEGEPDVDMVLASVPPDASMAVATSVYSDVISHCNRMSSDCKGRIGFGQVPRGSSADDSKKLASNLVSDRFVLVAPNGVVGAVTGILS